MFKRFLFLIACLFGFAKSDRSLLDNGVFIEDADFDELFELLDDGYGIDSSKINKQYLIHRAIDLKKPKLAKLLLEWGGSTKLKNKNGFTPLHMAAYMGYAKLVEHMIKQFFIRSFFYKIDVQDSRFGKTALHYAASRGKVNTLCILLENDADVNAEDFRGMTPIEYAIDNGHFDIHHILIQEGALIPAGRTPINSSELHPVPVVD